MIAPITKSITVDKQIGSKYTCDNCGKIIAEGALSCPHIPIDEDIFNASYYDLEFNPFYGYNSTHYHLCSDYCLLVKLSSILGSNSMGTADYNIHPKNIRLFPLEEKEE